MEANGVLGVFLPVFMRWMLTEATLETRGFFWPWLLHFTQDVIIFWFIAGGSTRLNRWPVTRGGKNSEHNREESVELDGAPDRYATRRRERLLRLSARRVDRRGGGWGWLGGIALIAIGALLLIQNAGYFQQFTNWWPVAVPLFFVFLPRVRKAGVK